MEKKEHAPKDAKTLNHSTAAQRTRLLKALKIANQEGVTTIQAREQLDIMSPASRVQELREQGYNIQTVWTTGENAQGNKHRNARYVLVGSITEEGEEYD